ncbi:MAG: SOS response-associated peptidase [Hyphomicrobiaceae bacterium]
MCSRYSLTSPHAAVRNYFGYGNEHPFPPRYNIAPTDPVAIIRPGGRHPRELVLVRWGLIPSWVKEPAEFSTLINARAETLTEKPSFRGALRHKRCLVPANGFFEWTGPRGAKQPHYVHRAAWRAEAPDDAIPPLAFAGLYEDWLGPDGSEIDTMVIVTVPANREMRTVHDRMPALLEPAEFDAWLDVKSVRDEVALKLLGPAPDQTLALTAVSPEINNPRAEGAELLQPAIPRLL